MYKSRAFSLTLVGYTAKLETVSDMKQLPSWSSATECYTTQLILDMLMMLIIIIIENISYINMKIMKQLLELHKH